MTITVYGAPLSPFVRKVLMGLDMKGLDHKVVPVVPFDLPDGYHDISPLGKIPALVDGDFSISDSTVICEYLEQKYEGASLYPASPESRARARWFEEYSDSVVVQVCGSKLFFERVLKPKFLNQPCDDEVVNKNLAEDMPAVLSYLESQLGEEGFLVGESLTMADVSIASNFVNARYAQFMADEGTYPKFCAWLERVWGTPAFAARLELEQQILATM